MWMTFWCAGSTLTLWGFRLPTSYCTMWFAYTILWNWWVLGAVNENSFLIQAINSCFFKTITPLLHSWEICILNQPVTSISSWSSNYHMPENTSCTICQPLEVLLNRFYRGSDSFTCLVVVDHCWQCYKSMSRTALWQYWIYRAFVSIWFTLLQFSIITF